MDYCQEIHLRLETLVAHLGILTITSCQKNSVTDFFHPSATGPMCSVYLGQLEITWDFRFGACTN